MLESTASLQASASRALRPSKQEPLAKITIMKSLLSLRRMQGFERLLHELYEASQPSVLPSLRQTQNLETLISEKQVTPAQLAILRHLHFSPIIIHSVKRLEKEFDNLQHGKTSFRLLDLYFGITGGPPRSKMEAALALGMTPKEIEEVTAGLKRQLATTAIKGIVLDAVEESLEEFLRSSLYSKLHKRNQCFLPAADLTLPDTIHLNRLPAKEDSDKDQRQNGQGTAPTVIVTEGELDFTPTPKRLWQTEIATSRVQTKASSKTNGRSCDFEELLATLLKEKKVIFSGPPGSGKSTLARELALTLAKSGKRTALLCHSKLNVLEHQEALKHELQGQPNLKSTLTITTYHSLCIACGKEANIPIPRTRTNYVFNQAFPKILSEAMEANAALKYQAIIVDEGHSLHANMLHTLNNSLIDSSETYLALFQDDALIPQHFQENAINAQLHLFLKNSFRPVERLLESNESLEAYEVFNRNERNETLSALLTQLIYQQGNSPTDIAVLSLKKELILNRLELPDKLKLRQSTGNRPNSIYSGSVFGFRSSSRPIVIINDLGEFIHEAKPVHIETFKHIIFGRAAKKLIFLCDQFSLSTFLQENQQVLRLDSCDFLAL